MTRRLIPAVRTRQPVMDMYGTPAKRAQRLVEDTGCRLVDTQESGSAWPDWLCLRYCVVR